MEKKITKKQEVLLQNKINDVCKKDTSHSKKLSKNNAD